MKNKFWIGFLLGVTGILLGLVGLEDCKTRKEKGLFMAGWGVGTIIIVFVFITIALVITR